MPLDKYFEGHGEKVMKSMRKQYGAKKAKNVFYATANKKKDLVGPSKEVKHKRGIK